MEIGKKMINLKAEKKRWVFSFDKVGKVSQVRQYSFASEVGTSQNNQFTFSVDDLSRNGGGTHIIMQIATHFWFYISSIQLPTFKHNYGTLVTCSNTPDYSWFHTVSVKNWPLPRRQDSSAHLDTGSKQHRLNSNSQFNVHSPKALHCHFQKQYRHMLCLLSREACLHKGELIG